ncbi:MAG: hypothetical protein D6726_03840 [Nitrospirae bacterium]|nr:MAG: hypothetical protein D6726_03840 [Nitrospirota bacterium]
MKKVVIITLLAVALVSVTFATPDDASAMNNESAALLTAGIVLLGIPIMNAIAQESQPHHERVYYNAPERVVYKKVYIYEEAPGWRKHRRHAYRRGWRDEWRYLERRDYERGRRDAWREYYGY